MSGRALYFATTLALLFGIALVIATVVLVHSRKALWLRTQTLLAFCHDLLTPLARLRLRTERLDAASRGPMLHDIDGIDRLLREAIDYVRHDARAERTERIDLVSVLRTICSEFADVGHDVTYDGPERLVLRCKGSAITRAITNLVDNATKHGREVQVRLIDRWDTVDVEISDDGPGIPRSLHAKVFDAFFKGNEGRNDPAGGFGLGLAIARDIARSHRGRIVLHDRVPRGLTVCLSLPGTLAVRRHPRGGEDPSSRT